MTVRRLPMAVLLFSLLIVSDGSPSAAKVSMEEAAGLKTTLTPFGAERAGNADGTIPPWDGGITGPPEGIGYKGPGTYHPDPYADDKALFAITAGNVDQYADKLAKGQVALLKKYPDTYKINVYPTRRSHAAPEWVYAETFKNATRCDITPDRLGVVGGYGGVPFPIPGSAEEMIINHNLRWQGESRTGRYHNGIVRPDGQIDHGGSSKFYELSPFYLRDGSPDTHNGGLLWVFVQYFKPPRRKGEILLIKDPVNMSASPRKAWQYLPGQRRVRRAPTVAHDTPGADFSGKVTYDQIYMFNGSLERYDWKIVGKKEMYIPYNCYKWDLARDEKAVLTARHPNPEFQRWELHRVWVVAATLKKGKRHTYGKRVFYLDEDSWVITQVDAYDTRGNLWRMGFCMLKNVYEIPATYMRTNIYMDLTAKDYCFNFSLTGIPEFISYERVSPDVFTSENVRRVGKR